MLNVFMTDLPLLVSVILVFMYAISIFRKQKPDYDKLKAACVGILSVVITSVAMMILPRESTIDLIASYTLRMMCVISILFAIGYTCEGKTKGIKIAIAVPIVIIIFGLIGKLVNI